MENTMHKKIYQALQDEYVKQTGLKVGDSVEVVHTVADYQCGWDAARNWEGEMDEVGRVLTVNQFDEDGTGIQLSDGYFYPFFAIHPIPNQVKDVAGYTAEITGNGIQIGCQTITLEKFDELAKAVEEVRG